MAAVETVNAVEALVRRRIEPDAAVLSVKDANGYGVVLYTCPAHTGGPFRFIVHRYAFVDTSGLAIANGGMLYAGGYYMTLDEAQADYDARSPR